MVEIHLLRPIADALGTRAETIGEKGLQAMEEAYTALPNAFMRPQRPAEGSREGMTERH